MITQKGFDRVLKDLPWLWAIHPEWDPIRVEVIIEEASDPGIPRLLLETDFIAPHFVSTQAGVEPRNKVWVHYRLGCTERVVQVSGAGPRWPGYSVMSLDKAILNATPLGAVLEHVALVGENSRYTRKHVDICVIRPPRNSESGQRCFYNFLLEHGCNMDELEKRKRWILKTFPLLPKNGESRLAVYALLKGAGIFTEVSGRRSDDTENMHAKIIAHICVQQEIAAASDLSWYALSTEQSYLGARLARFEVNAAPPGRDFAVTGWSSCDKMEQIEEGYEVKDIRQAFREFTE